MSATDWNRFREDHVRVLGLESEDADRLISLLKQVFGEEGQEHAKDFLLKRNDGLGASPRSMMYGGNVLGAVRVLDYLKDARGKP